ncbi:hypothetical protein [Pedobacter cryoconitis]|uniref:hypothetical protein n=1 Tax=Pedobacter cryoconitis TaxID=188932 RepID=UPI0016073DDF|nr:hypothetical protein [Pedobacter cryoconitis]MBB5649129.1 hypothetical protein [Pedobacter cryoconitis]
MDVYEEWELIESPLTEFYLYELNDGFDGLKIVLRELGSSNKKLEIFYPNFLGYRLTDESGRLKTLYENDTLGPFNKTNSSEFINWFIEESRGVSGDQSLTHYNILSSNKILDVISDQLPVVKWL